VARALVPTPILTLCHDFQNVSVDRSQGHVHHGLLTLQVMAGCVFQHGYESQLLQASAVLGGEGQAFGVQGDVHLNRVAAIFAIHGTDFDGGRDLVE
jgi:hypothetical protein